MGDNFVPVIKVVKTENKIVRLVILFLSANCIALTHTLLTDKFKVLTQSFKKSFNLIQQNCVFAVCSYYICIAFFILVGMLKVISTQT